MSSCSLLEMSSGTGVDVSEVGADGDMTGQLRSGRMDWYLDNVTYGSMLKSEGFIKALKCLISPKNMLNNPAGP